MNKDDLSIKGLAETRKIYFQDWSVKKSILVTVAFVMLLIVIWRVFDGPNSILTAVHPRRFGSIPAILFANFFHVSASHLISNLIIFVPLCFLALKLESMRGFVGIFVGMLVCGAAVWLFGEKGTATAGFSGAVMACWGILLVSVIRRDYLLVVIFLFFSYVFMEFSLFDTLRPSAEAGNISWRAHLGGVIGGMASQIRSLPIALELLYKAGKVTKEEFIVIANRIHEDEEDEVLAKNFHKAVNDFQESVKENTDSKNHSTRKNTDGKG